jgi:hypothetical protein
VGVLLTSQLASSTHPRPKGATPLRVSLVPAFKQCSAPNRTHGAPLAFPSCNPPAQSSDFLTVGTPDANGASANSIGFFRLDVKVGVPGPPDDSAVLAKASVSDVRCKPATDASVCSSPNATGGPDYSGQLEGNATIRISDHFNGPNGNEAATVRDIPFPLNLQCQNTADTSIGGFCQFPNVTCLSCPPPKDGQRTVVELAQFEVYDGGADGNVATAGNTVFLRQGLFIP